VKTQKSISLCCDYNNLCNGLCDFIGQGIGANNDCNLYGTRATKSIIQLLLF